VLSASRPQPFQSPAAGRIGGLAAQGLASTLAAAGVAALAGFVTTEGRSAHPLLPPDLFASRQFTSANVVTFAVYAALGGVFFFLVVCLQVVGGFSPLLAGMAMLPVTVIMLALSARAGALSARIGPHLPQPGGQVRDHLDILAHQALQHIGHSGDQPIHRGRHRLSRLLPAERQQLSCQFRGPARGFQRILKGSLGGEDRGKCHTGRSNSDGESEASGHTQVCQARTQLPGGDGSRR